MKRMGSIVVTLKHSGIFFEDIFLKYFCGFLEFFLCLKTLFLDFHQENFLVTQILKCFTVYNYNFFGSELVQ